MRLKNKFRFEIAFYHKKRGCLKRVAYATKFWQTGFSKDILVKTFLQELKILKFCFTTRIGHFRAATRSARFSIKIENRFIDLEITVFKCLV